MRPTLPHHPLNWLVCIVVCLSVPSGARSQGTTRYVYDDNGRLHAVISPAGEATIYEYDPAGNFTAIRRLTANDLELLSFSPHEGVPGDLVTFVGVGFNGGVSTVSFNGTLSNNVQVTPPIVVAEVPQGATTGPVMITTTRGSLTTPVPFTIRGVRVSPSTARIVSGASVQFAVMVVLSGDQSVKWSVNGVEGGNAAVGAISTSGLYTAPNLPQNLPTSLVFIRATSNAAPEVFGEAQVTVLNPEFIRVAQASGVSVRIGNTTPISPTSGGVSVRIGNTLSASPTSAGVSLTTGPNILAIAPIQITRGTTVTVTMSGANLNGAIDIKFIEANGAIDPNTTASSLNVNADGTSLTATLNVSANAALGQRVVIVITAGGHSQTVDTGTNTIAIQ